MTEEQLENSHDILENLKEKDAKNKAEHLAPFQYKKGQSGNPNGRPKGSSLKEYIKVKFAHMTDEEKEDFLNGLSKDIIWKMGEGNWESKTDVTSDGKAIKGNGIIFSNFTDATDSQ